MLLSSPLLYRTETWTTDIRHLTALEQHHPRFHQRILGIWWEDRCTNISVLKEANTNNIATILIQHQLRWTGHIIHMPNMQLPKQIYYHLKEGQQDPGGQEKHGMANIMANLKKLHITLDNWEHTAPDWRLWSKTV